MNKFNHNCVVHTTNGTDSERNFYTNGTFQSKTLMINYVTVLCTGEVSGDFHYYKQAWLRIMPCTRNSKTFFYYIVVQLMYRFFLFLQLLSAVVSQSEYCVSFWRCCCFFKRRKRKALQRHKWDKMGMDGRVNLKHCGHCRVLNGSNYTDPPPRLLSLSSFPSSPVYSSHFASVTLFPRPTLYLFSFLVLSVPRLLTS